MAVAAAMTIALNRVAFTGNDALVYAKTALITGLVTTIAWVIATFVTSPESDETLVAFYRRVHPTVYGWRRIAELVPDLPQVRDVASNAFNWVMGVILVYGCLFGIGKLVFGEWMWGILLLALASRGLSHLLGSLAPRLGDAFGHRDSRHNSLSGRGGDDVRDRRHDPRHRQGRPGARATRPRGDAPEAAPGPDGGADRAGRSAGGGKGGVDGGVGRGREVAAEAGEETDAAGLAGDEAGRRPRGRGTRRPGEGEDRLVESGSKTSSLMARGTRTKRCPRPRTPGRSPRSPCRWRRRRRRGTG